MKERIDELFNQLYEDIQKFRNGADEDVSQRAGIEIMALNAMCNVHNALKETEYALCIPRSSWTIFSSSM